MKYKILAAVLGLGALGYIFRNQIVQKIDQLGWWLDGAIEDPTPDENEAPPIPEGGEGFGIAGSRAYPTK